MSVEKLNDAIDSVLESRLAFCKFLSANDTGATGGHQSGILVSKSAKDILFYESLDISPIMKRNVQIHWMDDIVTDSVFQVQSLNSTVQFVGPDPDDDFQMMEGVITPDTWEAFAPQLPSKILYNLLLCICD